MVLGDEIWWFLVQQNDENYPKYENRVRTVNFTASDHFYFVRPTFGKDQNDIFIQVT